MYQNFFQKHNSFMIVYFQKIGRELGILATFWKWIIVLHEISSVEKRKVLLKTILAPKTSMTNIVN